MGEKHWYVIHTQAGSEERVKKNLEQRIKSFDASDKITRIIIPTEPEIEVKDGHKHTVQRKVMPGYLLVEMEMNNKTWNIVRNTPGVTGFISAQDKDGKLVPIPLSKEQVEAILNRRERAVPKVRVSFSPGESVRIISGPFVDFVGVVDEIYPEKGKVRVLVSFFGRETPVELDIAEVERI